MYKLQLKHVINSIISNEIKIVAWIIKGLI